jgi:hypothetical protein
MLDYGVAATFLTMAARYRDSNRAAARLALINGAMVLGVSLFTDYPGGVWRKLSFKTHGILDGAQAALAGLGPMMFGFADRSEARFFYSQAASEVGVIASTDWNAGAANRAIGQLA